MLRYADGYEFCSGVMNYFCLPVFDGAPDTRLFISIVIDEVQKLPKILDEVHRLISKRKLQFILTGSSARKIKHGGANLLGEIGRASCRERV